MSHCCRGFPAIRELRLRPARGGRPALVHASDDKLYRRASPEAKSYIQNERPRLRLPPPIAGQSGWVGGRRLPGL